MGDREQRRHRDERRADRLPPRQPARSFRRRPRLERFRARARGVLTRYQGERSMSLADDLAKLEELRRTGALTETEFAKAKAAVLVGGAAPAGDAVAGKLGEQLSEVRYQNELERIDREWAIEKEKYTVADKHGRRHIPTTGAGIATAAIGGVFGLFWTIMAFGITSGAPGEGPFQLAKVFFPLFGIVFTVL